MNRQYQRFTPSSFRVLSDKSPIYRYHYSLAKRVRGCGCGKGKMRDTAAELKLWGGG